MDLTKVSSLAGRSILSLSELNREELFAVLDLSDQLKQAKLNRQPHRFLEGMNIAMIFEKLSTRTRCASFVAASDLGASAEYLGSKDIHLGVKESTQDTAKVLGRMFDGIMYRGFAHETVEKLAEHAGVPVWNGLTDLCHPTQALADLMTIREEFPGFKDLKVVYIGDGRNNVALSLMRGCAYAGLNMVNCTPPELTPAEGFVKELRKVAAERNALVHIEHDPAKAVTGANVIYTDVWVSMGEEDAFDERVALLKPYQVNMKLMEQTGNLDSNNVIFLHCLPAFHDQLTKVTADIGALEVTDDVFQASFSKVFELAENRMHTIKAIMLATLSGAIKP
jgi:ornithine carbamoyltransferase